ncbi:DivIVA domain-containing protein [Microcella humidisoli]|uniref:DivIVA domain-containing protein n=1 Tax=Microcella humidisoli TaxID=2963406 RepID=A0ABY5FUK9_9MICO|nr:DivIVA domain-containing protein [Microcella humidisoli]UTT61819.1 DivIVA domain-containing protein [Microcella humidisoli]
MTSTFPLARSGKPGYDAEEVDAFLERAREAFSAPLGDGATLTSDEIRHTAFRVVRKDGYSARHVDAALERLEEAFAGREREQGIASLGAEAYYAQARATAQEIIDRLARPAGKKFRRLSPLTRGYHPADVDAFAVRISAYFENGQALPVETVRTIAFRPRYRGYDEAQVDLLLDTVIGLMLAVR